MIMELFSKVQANNKSKEERLHVDDHVYKRAARKISQFISKMLDSGPGVVLSRAPILSCSKVSINTGLPDVSKHGEMQTC